MIRLGGHWTITLADLSLILFMATAMAVQEPSTAEVRASPLPAEGEPVAIYRPGAGAPPLRQWLDGQMADDRLKLTILARHDGTDTALKAAEAARLAAEAGPRGADARIVVERGAENDLLAVLAYDRTPDQAPLAQSLQR